MRIGFRADASRTIGTGHLQRCVALARTLAEHGAAIHFAIRSHDDVAGLTFGDAFPVTWLDPSKDAPVGGQVSGPTHGEWAGSTWTEDAADSIRSFSDFRPDFIIVDHYGLDARWHAAVRSGLGCKLVAIDDLGDRPLAVDILLDGNFALDHRAKFSGHLSGQPRMLTGPRYAIVSDVYQKAQRLHIRPVVLSVGVFMGGTDPDSASAKVLAALRADVGFMGPVEIVSTSANPNLEILRNACASDASTTLSIDLPDLATFYARHDVQIGGGGTATYERCCIGSPTVTLVLAENQLAVVPGLTAMGVVRPAQLKSLPATRLLTDAGELLDVFPDLATDLPGRKAMSERGMLMVDGKGSLRVSICLLAEEMVLRTATEADGPRLHAWRNHPSIRMASATQDEISIERHTVWLQRKLNSEVCRLYIASIGPTPVGSIRFDALHDGNFEVSLYLDPDLSQLGLGPRLLLAGERELTRSRRSGASVLATVLPGNRASQRLFVSCGYSGGPLRFEKHLRLEESER